MYGVPTLLFGEDSIHEQSWFRVQKQRFVSYQSVDHEKEDAQASDCRDCYSDGLRLQSLSFSHNRITHLDDFRDLG